MFTNKRREKRKAQELCLYKDRHKLTRQQVMMILRHSRASKSRENTDVNTGHTCAQDQFPLTVPEVNKSETNCETTRYPSRVRKKPKYLQ